MEKRRDLDHTVEEIEQLFADLWQVFPFSRGLRRGFRPQVDCYRNDEEFVVIAELPGIDPAEIQLVAGPRTLLIAGERARPKSSGHFQQMEIDYGPFQRQVLLDEDVDAEAATASYKRGMLRVKLPIAPKRAPQERVSIEVKLGR
jgi:HSP20 family protein